MINQTVIVELNTKALLTKRFNIHEEIVSILEQGEDNYAALIDALEKGGYADVADYLDEYGVPETCIDIDWEHVEHYRGYNFASQAVEFLIPFRFDADWVTKELLHNG